MAPVRDELIALLAQWGCSAGDPVVLSDRGNLILWCRPHPLVARVATLFAGDDPAEVEVVWRREVAVAEHLRRLGIAVVEPAAMVPAGPHPVAGTWMTLWRYCAPEAPGPRPEPGLALVRRLTWAMERFLGDLPARGAWIHPQEAVRRLRPLTAGDADVAQLVSEVERVEGEMAQQVLLPAHGDAHAGNLLWADGTWRWLDFEDASRMPRFWDVATFVARSALVRPRGDPLVRAALALPEVASDPEAFRWTLWARVTDSVATGLGLAVVGQGDVAAARRRLRLWAGFREQWGRGC